MTQQIKSHAHEHHKPRIGNVQLLEKVLPEQLVLEVENFKKRNSLSREVKGIGLVIKDCCPRCLKAHIIKKARVLGIEKEAQYYVNSLKCDVGHNGYYLDGDELLTI